jgi:TonB family protein
VTAVASHTKAHPPAATPSFGAEQPLYTLTGKPLLALTQDRRLLETLRAVSDPAHEVCATGSEIDLATALVGHHPGVVVLDTAALATPAPQLAARLHNQFPDVVLIVAGGATEQTGLTAQITDGSVHRFLHKPVSEQRVRLFVESAWRRHAETETVNLQKAAAPASGGAGAAARWLLIVGLAAIAAPLAWWYLHAPAGKSVPAAAAPLAPSAPAAAASDPALEALLARADRALAAGALVAPPGASAADLYREALRRSARDPRAVAGLEQVIDRLLADADAQQQAGHLDEAQHLADEAHAISPGHPRVAFLTAQIGAQRERALLERASRAAAAGNVAGALAVLDDAARAGHPSTLVSEARQQLAHKQVNERITEFLTSAHEALERGQLIEPVEQNARFFVASAQALAPTDAQVQQAAQELITRLKAEAGKALAAGNLEQAEVWTAAASDLGAPPAEVAALRGDAQRARGAAKSASLAQLTLAFNERLANGRILEPPADSARSYLAQLEQADADDPATQQARSAYRARLLEEARGALHAQDYAAAGRWLAEARSAAADPPAIAAIEQSLGTAQQEAQASAFVSASSLTRTHYVPPEFPVDARQRGIGGWVDLQFQVNTDGSVGEAIIVGAQPVGVFEQAALDAVRHWTFQPVVRAGQPVSQRARVRVRFALQ